MSLHNLISCDRYPPAPVAKAFRETEAISDHPMTQDLRTQSLISDDERIKKLINNEIMVNRIKQTKYIDYSYYNLLNLKIRILLKINKL